MAARKWVCGPNSHAVYKILIQQQYIVILQESRKKCIQKCERKLENRLLERLQKLEISIDKLIAEADRLMIMERNEMLVSIGLT